MSGVVGAIAAFNLVCTGTVTTGAMAGKLGDGEKEAATVTYRVDLDQRRWCSNECLSTAPIVSVTDTQIVFQSYKDDTVDLRSSVNRESGALLTAMFLPSRFYLTEAICERGPFSGFPERKF